MPRPSTRRAGVATCTTTFSAAGIYGIDAAYSGDGNYLPSSTPSSTALTVAAAPNAPVTQSDTTQPSGSTGATGATGATGSGASTPSGSTGTTGSSGRYRLVGEHGLPRLDWNFRVEWLVRALPAPSGSAGSQGSTGTSGSTGSNGAAPCPSASSGSAAPLDLSGTSTSLSICGGVVVATSDGKTTAQASLASVSAIDVKGGALTIDASGGSFSMPIGYDGPSLTVTGSTTESDWTLNGDGTGSVVGGGVAGISFNDVASVAASGQATLHGPSSNSTWDLTGPGSGTLTLTGSSSAGTAFAGFANLTGAANNDDTFTLEPGGSVSGLIDGGPAGFDTVIVGGHPDSVVSNPTDPHSGTLVVDGVTTAYTGMEPLGILKATNITVNGAADGLSSPLPQGDQFDVSPYVNPSIGACATAGNCIQITDNDALTDSIQQAEFTYFVIAGTNSLTINGGAGSDKTEFKGNYLVPNSTLTVNTESIKVDSSVTITAHNVNFNAAETDDGIDKFGIDTTLLGDNATIELDSAALNGGTLDLEASATNAATTVSGTQSLTGAGDNLMVATTTPFLSRGEFTIAGLVDGLGNPQVCTYTGTSGRDEFTGVSGCIGVVSAGAEVDSVGILEDGSTTGFEHSALQLIYGASINIHGSSAITSSGDVTLASTVNVTGTANGRPVNWITGKEYSKGDVVIDPIDGNLYSANADITAANNTSAPSTDSSDWSTAKGQNAAVAASSLVATATSQLSGTSSISAPSGNVKITSSVTSNITTTADATQSKSGAGIAVGVVVTDSEAFVDSTAPTPVNAKGLTVSADTNNAAPTSGTASPGGGE